MSNITAGTIGRLIALIVSFTTLSTIVDLNNLEEVLTIIFTIIISLAGYWKDNDITKKARERKIKLKELEQRELALEMREKALLEAENKKEVL